MRKILFLMSSYPSISSANVLCNEQIINCLKNENYSIYVMTYKSYNNTKEQLIDNVNVNRIHRSVFYEKVLWAKDNKQNSISKLILKLDRFFLRIRQIITIPIYPRPTLFLPRKVGRAAIKLHKKENFDMVISEFHGFETLYAGYMLKEKYPDIKFLPIFWDSLSGGFLAKYLPKKYCLKKRLACEDKLLSNADQIVVMDSSKEFFDKNISNMPYYNRLNWFGIPRIILPHEKNGSGCPSLQENRINIVFTGILNIHDRNPEYMIKLLNCVNCDNVTLLFFCIGNCIEWLENAAKNFNGNLIVSGYIPKNQLINVMHKADFFLNIGTNNANFPPSKIYEYMSYGKPIISTYGVDNDAGMASLNKYPLTLGIDQREKDININIKKLEDFIRNNTGKTVEFDDIKDTFKNNTPDVYVELIKKMLNDNEDKCDKE